MWGVQRGWQGELCLPKAIRDTGGPGHHHLITSFSQYKGQDLLQLHRDGWRVKHRLLTGSDMYYFSQISLSKTSHIVMYPEVRKNWALVRLIPVIILLHFFQTPKGKTKLVLALFSFLLPSYSASPEKALIQRSPRADVSPPLCS